MKSKAGAGTLVTLTDPRSAAAEAYRTLRTNLQLSSLDRPIRTLLVTGAGAEEDETAVLCNLAVVLAQAGTTVVVADCDLRRPRVHEVFGLGNDKGLTTALLDEKAEHLPLQPTAVPGLQVLTAGPPPLNPADLLGTRRMQRVIESLAGRAELALFDGPPVALVADAAMLAGRLDGTLLVVSAGKTRRETASRARALLEKANARVLGVVLSNVRLNADLQRYYGSTDR